MRASPSPAPASPIAGYGHGIALMLATMTVFATQDGITKHLSTEYAVPEILWVRYTFFVFFALWMTRREGLRRTLRSAMPILQVLRAATLVCEISLFILALRHLPLAGTQSVMACTPLVVTALSVPMLGEQVGLRRWSAVAIGLIGMLVILRPGFGVFQPAMGFALAASFLYSLYQILTRKVSLVDGSGTTLVYTAIVGAVILTAVGPFYWRMPDAAGWGLLLTIALTAATGHLLFIKALGAAPASVLQPFSYLLLVWATIIGYLFFGNLPDGPTVVGAGIIVASGLYTLYRERRKRGQLPAARSAAPAPPSAQPDKSEAV